MFDDFHDQDPDFKRCTYTGNNIIITEWRQHEALVRFIVEYGMITLLSNRCSKIMTIIPATWVARGIEVKDAIKKLKIITDLEKIFQAIISSKDDEELIDIIGIETYGFIKFLLNMNQAISIEICKTLCCFPRCKQFQMGYTSEIEKNFKRKDTVLLFHGTPAENIMPILAKGLLNCSDNNDLRLNGAAYGKGIYLSDEARFSLSYCRVATTATTATTDTGSLMAMLVYEVQDSPKWFKTTNIYVVDDESALILRYVIVISDYNYTTDASVFTKLTSIMSSKILKAEETKKEAAKMAAMSKVYNKRLMIEYKQLLNKSVADLGFSINLAEEGNLRVWKVCIPASNLNNSILEVQMQKLGIPFLELEISFPEGYPIEPPFPRVVYPRFQSLTGHITAGGSICMEAISRSGWVPTTNMESLITQIKLVLVEGDAKINETHIGQRYHLAEAKEAFQRAMETHGWA